MSRELAFSIRPFRVHVMWQTDFPFFHIIGWGWSSLSTVRGDSSRYIIAWKLSAPMGAIDVTETLDQALAITGVEPVRVKHRPRLLSDNGPAVGASELREDLGERGMAHTRGRPYPPQTLGKNEFDLSTKASRPISQALRAGRNFDVNSDCAERHAKSPA